MDWIDKGCGAGSGFGVGAEVGRGSGTPCTTSTNITHFTTTNTSRSTHLATTHPTNIPNTNTNPNLPTPTNIGTAPPTTTTTSNTKHRHNSTTIQLKGKVQLFGVADNITRKVLTTKRIAILRICDQIAQKNRNCPPQPPNCMIWQDEFVNAIDCGRGEVEVVVGDGGKLGKGDWNESMLTILDGILTILRILTILGEILRILIILILSNRKWVEGLNQAIYRSLPMVLRPKDGWELMGVGIGWGSEVGWLLVGVGRVGGGVGGGLIIVVVVVVLTLLLIF